MNLNEFQRRAVECTDGPVLVLAGPGSGKTKTIIERIKYLVMRKQTLPERILVVTFTKLAAAEMKNRYQDMMSEKGKTPFFSTIHALCYEVIRRKKKVERIEISTEAELESLMTEAKELFMQEPLYLKLWQNLFDYILIDEFQDTSELQMDILILLAGNKGNIMAVGDDDQAIYGFRGGDSEVFLKFLTQYPYAKKIQLKVNYRSQEEIVRLAEALIEHNQERMSKESTICVKKKFTDLQDLSNRQPIVMQAFESQWKQMEYIIKEIKKWKDEGAVNRIAVLFRSKMQFRLFLICAKLYGLPIYCKESKKAESYFFIDEICSYLRVISGTGKREDYVKIINRPNRGIDRGLLNTWKVDEKNWLQSAKKEGMQQAQRVSGFLLQLDALRKMPPYIALCHLFYQIGYKNELMNRLEKTDMMIDKFTADGMLTQILQRAKTVSTLQNLCEILEEETLEEHNGVEVMTIHASKGLEFDAVFLPDLNEGIIPNKKAVQSSNIEEERRLLYVGITRAKEAVYLSYVTKKNNANINPSVFVDELII